MLRRMYNASESDKSYSYSKRRAAIYQIMKYVLRSCTRASVITIQGLRASHKAPRRINRQCFNSKYLTNNFDTRSVVVTHFKGKENERPAVVARH